MPEALASPRTRATLGGSFVCHVAKWRDGPVALCGAPMRAEIPRHPTPSCRAEGHAQCVVCAELWRPR